MAGVEQPDLHHLIGVDVGDHLRPDPLPRRPAGRKTVLDDPLLERLGDHRPAIDDSERLAHQIAVGIGRRGRDPVDHAVRESAVLRDPSRQLLVPALGEGEEHPACDVAIALQVVAGHDREGGEAALAAAIEGLREVAERPARRMRVLEVVPDVRVGRVELPGALVHVVSTLGDGERDDAAHW